MSAACATHANPPAKSPVLNSPMLMDATARFMARPPSDDLFFSSVRRLARPCQWRDAAAACGSFGQPVEGASMSTATFTPGGYRFIPAVFQYSGGVAAEPGFTIVRVRFHAPVALAEGFARIAQVIRAAGRPLTAFCAWEPRSGAPFTEDRFRAFNEIYAGTRETWGLYDGRTNPVARSNTSPTRDPPCEPSFHAFCYTVAVAGPLPTFVV